MTWIRSETLRNEVGVVPCVFDLPDGRPSFASLGTVLLFTHNASLLLQQDSNLVFWGYDPAGQVCLRRYLPLPGSCAGIKAHLTRPLAFSVLPFAGLSLSSPADDHLLT